MWETERARQTMSYRYEGAHGHDSNNGTEAGVIVASDDDVHFQQSKLPGPEHATLCSHGEIISPLSEHALSYEPSIICPHCHKDIGRFATQDPSKCHYHIHHSCYCESGIGACKVCLLVLRWEWVGEWVRCITEERKNRENIYIYIFVCACACTKHLLVYTCSPTHTLL